MRIIFLLAMLAMAGCSSTDSARPDTAPPPFVGHGYDLHYDNGFHVEDRFVSGSTMEFTVLSGPQAGRHGSVSYQWDEVAPGVYVIHWTEADGGTVLHVDDFNRKLSRSYYVPSGQALVVSTARIT